MFQKSVKKSALKSAQKSSYPFKSTQNSAQKSSFPQKGAQKSTLKSTFGSSDSICSIEKGRYHGQSFNPAKKTFSLVGFPESISILYSHSRIH